MKFSGKMYLMEILKVRKNQGYILSVDDTISEKPQGESNWAPPAFLELTICFPEVSIIVSTSRKNSE